MCTLVEERIIQVGVSVHNVTEKRLELCPYDLPIVIRSSSGTPVQGVFHRALPKAGDVHSLSPWKFWRAI